MKILTYWFARLFRRGQRPAPGYGEEVMCAGWVDLPAACRKLPAPPARRPAASHGRLAHG